MDVLHLERNDRSQGKDLRTWVEAVFQLFDGQVHPFAAKTALRCSVMHVPDALWLRHRIATIAAQRWH